jgi:hypothetical protein
MWSHGKSGGDQVATTRAGTVRFVVGLPAAEVSSRLGRALSQPS